jgi:hypothetical protein
MKGLIVVGCTLRELEAFKQVEPAVGAHGIKVFLAVLAVAAGKQQAAGAIRHQFTTISTWLVRVSEHKVSRHLLHGQQFLRQVKQKMRWSSANLLHGSVSPCSVAMPVI